MIDGGADNRRAHPTLHLPELVGALLGLRAEYATLRAGVRLGAKYSETTSDTNTANTLELSFESSGVRVLSSATWSTGMRPPLLDAGASPAERVTEVIEPVMMFLSGSRTT